MSFYYGIWGVSFFHLNFPPLPIAHVYFLCVQYLTSNSSWKLWNNCIKSYQNDWMHSIMHWHDDFSPFATPSCCPLPSAGTSSWLSKMWQDFTYKCDFIINLKIIFTSLMLNHVSLAPCLIPWFAPHFTKEHHLIYFREMKP